MTDFDNLNMEILLTQASLIFMSSLNFIMPPTLKKLMGHIAFGASVSAWVRECVGHTFCTYCNF